jgi:ATP-dependent Lon protease
MAIPVLPARDLVLFPGMIRMISVGRPGSLGAVRAHVEHGEPLVVVPQVDPEEEDPMSAELAPAGCVARVLRLSKLPDGTVRLLLEGEQRARCAGPLKLVDEVYQIEVEALDATNDDPVEVGAAAREIERLLEQLAASHNLSPAEHWALAATADDPEHLIDQAAVVSGASPDTQRALLAEPSLSTRVSMALDSLVQATARFRIRQEVDLKVQSSMDDAQREYQLREQLKVLKAELSSLTGHTDDTSMFDEKIAAAGMPEAVEDEVRREADRLTRIQPETAEYTMLRTWIETAIELPWSERTADRTSLKVAQRVLDREHHGLDKVKERILEYLAVRKLNPDSKGPILCFVGPPGVGKTSLGRSVASALGRRFGRIALGGVKDETEIRGHRRTYVGALPGRILRALARAGTTNPVLVLDELDKVGNDFRGDPASALLEVLDPQQNSAFVDHYLDLPVDLSQVLFIATANLVDTIPPALLDRLEVIELPGYTEEEKVVIARKHLLPRLGQRHGLSPKTLSIETRTLQRVVRDYTREAGLRDLERQLATLHRKVARQVVEGEVDKIRLTATQVPRYLGPPRFYNELAEENAAPGVVVGLAWTAAGGDILFVEATKMPGKRSLKLTGSLGDVMKESAEAALSWLRSHALAYKVPAEAFETEFHLHVPAGAIPKDGPSAGVTMVTALASVVTGRPVRERLAMTGEITLRGKVLPVGGVKEKALAARRAGVRTVLLPRHNVADLQDIPTELREELSFVPVDTIDDVLRHALT